MSRLQGKHAFITGGSRGIGLAVAAAFVKNGAKVAIAGRNEESLSRAKAALGGDVLTLRCDVSSVADLESAYARIGQAMGHLDIVFANAGKKETTKFLAVTEAAFDETFAINVKGVFFTVQKAVPYLKRGASVILNASVSAHAGSPTAVVYAATKASIRALARNLSSALAGRGIRVNVVSPGPIQPVAPQDECLGTENVNLRNSPFALTVPAGRIGIPQEVAPAVVFLASDESSFMAGAEIVIDGGRTAAPDGAPVFQIIRNMDEARRAELVALSQRLYASSPTSEPRE